MRRPFAADQLAIRISSDTAKAWPFNNFDARRTAAIAASLGFAWCLRRFQEIASRNHDGVIIRTRVCEQQAKLQINPRWNHDRLESAEEWPIRWEVSKSATTDRNGLGVSRA
jgi:hypothetical protein